jgi:hypothetical protein
MKRPARTQIIKRLRAYGASNPEHVEGDTYRCVGKWRTVQDMMSCVCAAYESCDDDGMPIYPRLCHGVEHPNGNAEIVFDLAPVLNGQPYCNRDWRIDTPKARAK